MRSTTTGDRKYDERLREDYEGFRAYCSEQQVAPPSCLDEYKEMV